MQRKREKARFLLMLRDRPRTPSRLYVMSDVSRLLTRARYDNWRSGFTRVSARTTSSFLRDAERDKQQLLGRLPRSRFLTAVHRGRAICVTTLAVDGAHGSGVSMSYLASLRPCIRFSPVFTSTRMSPAHFSNRARTFISRAAPQSAGSARLDLHGGYRQMH